MDRHPASFCGRSLQGPLLSADKVPRYDTTWYSNAWARDRQLTDTKYCDSSSLHCAIEVGIEDNYKQYINKSSGRPSVRKRMDTSLDPRLASFVLDRIKFPNCASITQDEVQFVGCSHWPPSHNCFEHHVYLYHCEPDRAMRRRQCCIRQPDCGVAISHAHNRCLCCI